MDMANSNSFQDVAICIHINTSYGFMVMIRPTEKLVSLNLWEICQLDRCSIGLPSINYTALNATINQNLKSLRVSSSSNNPTGLSLKFDENDRFWEVIIFESQFVKLFYLFLDLISGTSINNHFLIFDFFSNFQNP